MTVKSFDARVKFTSSVKAIPASKPVSGNVFIFCNALNGLPLAMIFVGGLFLFSDDLRAEGRCETMAERNLNVCEKNTEFWKRLHLRLAGKLE
ncbi:hypothetical protein HMPREF2600_11210 [Neisseria sp. HMSC077D05]|nr:hypothetical protein HMPREF2600_11210 [Neisseria sp. HMSC077D05]